jgi:pimeloyl-ACP methyl ester carboxylesterase
MADEARVAAPLAVPIVAGTAIRGMAATVMMGPVLQRHPNAFLITLERWGVSIPLHESQEYIDEAIEQGMWAKGRDPAEPVVLVGHSQGGLAVLRYAIDHPEQALHVITVGTPWLGAVSAARVNGLVRRLVRRDLPALVDMAPDSQFLHRLHTEADVLGSRLTNIFSTREIFIMPYVSAHIPLAGTTNVLISTTKEYEHHLRVYGLSHPLDGHIEGRATHLGEMSHPEVRAVIWRTVEQVSRQAGRA